MCCGASTLIGGAHVAASAAVAGHGGVAIISPPGLPLLRVRVVVPGYAVQADIHSCGIDRRVVSCYVPPGRDRRVLQAIQDNLETGGDCWHLGGDLNVQLSAPRQGEEDLAEALLGGNAVAVFRHPCAREATACGREPGEPWWAAEVRRVGGGVSY